MNENQKKIYAAYCKAIKLDEGLTDRVCDACVDKNTPPSVYPCSNCVFIMDNLFKEKTQ